MNPDGKPASKNIQPHVSPAGPLDQMSRQLLSPHLAADFAVEAKQVNRRQALGLCRFGASVFFRDVFFLGGLSLEAVLSARLL